MPVGLFPRETADVLAVAPGEGGTSAPPQPGFFDNTFGAIATETEGGAVKGALAALPQTPATNVGLPPIGAPDWAYKNYEEAIKKQAAIPPEEFKAKLDKDSSELLDHFKANPHTTGLAGQTLGGLASGITRFLTGAAVAGPIGGAVVVGGSEGAATTRELRAQGIDENTADALGAGTALFAGGASLLPGGYGQKLVERVVTGAAANTLSGFTQRGLTHNVLEQAGYTAQAQQYRALDGQAMIADAVLGAGFGVVHHIFTPSTIDAAHAVKDADHVETSAPGIPTTPQARDAHVSNFDAASEALIRGDGFTMRPLADVETIANPHADAAREAAAREVDQAAAEVLGEPVAAPARVGEERRADAIQASRLAELTNKRDTTGLTPAETDEWAGILNTRRLTTRVAGRTIRGVGSYEAYTEMLGRGEGKPVVGFADSDMLHDTNAKHGYPVGDELIRATGETLAHYFGEGNVFRRASDTGGSDEFITHAATEAEHEANMAAAQQHMANMTLRAYDPKTGKLIGEKKGGAFSHGRGHDETSAAVAAKLDKQRRAAANLRRERNDAGTVDTKPADKQPADRGSTAAGSEAAGEAAKLDPVTQEAVDSAQRILDAAPDTKVAGENGEQTGKAALDEALAELNDAKTDGELARVAAACFGRG